MQKTHWKATIKLWIFSLLNIPMIFWLRPKVLELNHERAVIKIALRRRTQNHLRTMYFGVLSVGADIAGGIQMVHILQKDISKISFVFKDFQAEFLKRPEADVHFTCDDGVVIANTIKKALETHERENVLVHVVATTPSVSQEEPVARFRLTLSIKEKTTK